MSISFRQTAKGSIPRTISRGIADGCIRTVIEGSKISMERVISEGWHAWRTSGVSSSISTGPGSAIADETIQRIAQLYAVEKEAQGSPPERRIEIRQAQAKPIFDDLEIRLYAQLPSTLGKSPLAGAIRYALTRMARHRPDLDHGVLDIDINTAERAMRSVAIGYKNYLFVGSQSRARAAAIAYALIETAKLERYRPTGMACGHARLHT